MKRLLVVVLFVASCGVPELMPGADRVKLMERLPSESDACLSFGEVSTFTLSGTESSEARMRNKAVELNANLVVLNDNDGGGWSGVAYRCPGKVLQ